MLLYLIACLTTYLPSSRFSYAIYFVLGFPYLFVLAFAVILINIYLYYRRQKDKEATAADEAGAAEPVQEGATTQPKPEQNRNKKRIWWLLLLLLPACKNIGLTFAFHPQQWQMKKNTAALRIMTWNVREFADSIKQADLAIRRTIEGITEYHPDIVCMQLHYDSVTLQDGQRLSVIKIMDSLGYPYHRSFYDTYMANGKEHSYTRSAAIYSRLPIDSSGSAATVATPENVSEFQHYRGKVGFVDVKWQNKPLRLYTARWQSRYLYFNSDYRDRRLKQRVYNRFKYITEAYPSIEEIHQKEAAIIRQEMDKSPYPFIFCGDMNGLSTSYNCEYLKGENLQDAFIKGGWGIGATYTYDRFTPILRIDVCLPDKKFKVLQATVAEKSIAGHYPLISDIDWK